MKSALVFFLYFFGITISCTAQATRIEIKLDKIPSNTEVVSLEEQGFLVLYKIDEGRGALYNTWNITKFDTSFYDLWNVLVEIPTRFILQKTLNNTSTNQYIWTSLSSTQMRIDFLDLATGNHQSLTYALDRHIYSIRSLKGVGHDLYILCTYGPDFQISDEETTACPHISTPFRSAGSSAFKTGSYYYKLDLKNQLKQERPDICRGINLADRFQNGVLKSATMVVSMIKQKPSSRSEILLKDLDKTLTTLDSINLESPAKIYFQNAKLLTSRNNKAIIGTFDSAPFAPDVNPNLFYTQGFYSYTIDSVLNPSPINLYNLSTLKSARPYLASASNRSPSGEPQISTSFKTHLWLNEVIETDSEYFVTAEAFYPVYSKTSDHNGQATPSFEGYSYTFCLVLCFDKKGHLKWDQTLPLQFNRLYKTIAQKVNFTVRHSTLYASFNAIGKLNRVSVLPGSILAMEPCDWPRMNPDDEDISEYVALQTPWISDRTLIWGVQKIKNSSDQSREEKIILYIDEASCR